MQDMDENRGFAVIFVIVVLILVIAYCRMTVGDKPHQQARHANPTQDSAAESNPKNSASAP